MLSELESLSKKAFLTLVLVAFLTAVWKAADNYVANNISPGVDKIVLTLGYLTAGSALGSLVGFICATVTLGRSIDPDFSGFRIRNLKLHLIAIISGIAGAVATGFYIYATIEVEAGVITALTNISLVYVLLWELFREKKGFLVRPSVLAPLLLITVGAAICAYDGKSVPIYLLAYMVIGYGLLAAVSEMLEKYGANAGDSENMYVWRFLYFAFFTAAACVVLAIRLGVWDEYFRLILLFFSPFWLVIVAGNMVVVYWTTVSKTFYKKTSPVTFIVAIVSVQSGFGFLFTIVGYKLFPASFTEIPDTVVWLVRLVGIAFMTLGLFALGKIRKTVQ